MFTVREVTGAPGRDTVFCRSLEDAIQTVFAEAARERGTKTPSIRRAGVSGNVRYSYEWEISDDGAIVETVFVNAVYPMDGRNTVTVDRFAKFWNCI